MREAALRRITAMSAGELAAFKEKCAANGRKSAAMMTPAQAGVLRDTPWNVVVNPRGE